MLLSDLKLEIRISKLETISKSKYQMFKTLLLSLPHFEFWSFEFVSNFGFRASNLLTARGKISISPARGYPCLCLCLARSQITLTTPRRLIILHLLHIFFTDDRTFTVSPCRKEWRVRAG